MEGVIEGVIEVVMNGGYQSMSFRTRSFVVSM